MKKRIGFLKKWKKYSRKRKIITTVVSLVVVISLVSGGIAVASGKSEEVMKVSVQEVSASTGTISNSIVGTGTLAMDDSIEITIPSGVTVKDVKVESGDAVSKGDTLATVDQSSVLEAMAEVQDEMDTLDEEINDYKDEDQTIELEAKVSGTVKKVYGKKGTDVTDCIIENGALIVITLEDGSTVDVTYSGGTVKSVPVEKGDAVSKGDTLMIIKNDEGSAEYQQMVEERKDLAKTYKKLTALSKNGAIEATADGTISTINVSDSGSSTSSSDSSSTESKSNFVTPSSSTESVKATTLSTTTSVKAVTLSETVTENQETVSKESLHLEIKGTGTSNKETLVIPAPKKGETPVSEIKASDGTYTGKVVWEPAGGTFKAETTYRAKIILEAADGKSFSVDSIEQIEEGLVSGIQCSEGGKALSFQITFPATEETKQEKTSKNEEKTTTQQSLPSNKNTQSNQETQSETMSKTTQNTTGKTNSGSNESGSSFSGQSAAGSNVASAGSTVSGTTLDETDSSSQKTSTDSNEVVAFTMAGNDTMLITVSVDELDINSVEVGQEATVTLDAIEDQTFTGKVVKVGNTSSSSGNGVSKYSVIISIPKDEQMKVGMNASATIIVESVENIVTLPVIALQEKGNKSFVYTEKDSEGNLQGEVEVTTGLSDGTTVEIKDGLKDGEKVYYKRIGVSSDSKSGFKGGNMDGMNFGGDFSGNFGGDGKMPDKSNMPGGMPGAK